MVKKMAGLKMKSVPGLLKKHMVEVGLLVLLGALYWSRNAHVSQFLAGNVGRVTVVGAAILMTYLRGKWAGLIVAVLGLAMMYRVYEGLENNEEGEESEETEEAEEAEEGDEMGAAQ